MAHVLPNHCGCIIIFIYLLLILYYSQNFNIYRIFNLFNFKKAADTDLVIVQWHQSKRGKSMHYEKISQTHININTLHLQIKQKSFLQVINNHLVFYIGL